MLLFLFLFKILISALSSIIDVISSSLTDKVSILLELMNIILKYKKNEKIIDNLKNINLDTIDNSTKFLILNILEN